MSASTCFVIMPFGDKLNIDGRLIDLIDAKARSGASLAPGDLQTIAFDKIYTYIIERAVERVGDMVCLRCDKIAGAGSIHADMFGHIWRAEVTVVDISTLNANVFYELGVRHALHSHTTVLIQRKGTAAPFNIQGFRVITYDETDLQSVDESIKEIEAFIRKGRATQANDSPVRLHLPALKVGIGADPAALQLIDHTSRYDYTPQAHPEVRIGLITGDISDIKGIDVWVNSENRNMQMARYHDRSISGTVRWLGAQKDPYTDRITEDTIALELAARMKGAYEVDGGAVIPTGPGQLRQTHGVKMIFHAAAVDGQPRKGYHPIPDIAPCITRALKLMDSEAEGGEPLVSIVFPLMGTGTGRGEVRAALELLVRRSLAHFVQNPATKVRRVHFLAPLESILKLGLEVLDGTPGLTRSA